MNIHHLSKAIFLAGAMALMAVLPSLGLHGAAGLSVALVSALLFFLYVGGIFRNRLFFAVCCMPVVFNYVWFVISFVLLELGAYTPELRMAGSNTGGTARLVFFLFIFLSFAQAGFRVPSTAQFSWQACEKQLANLLYIVGGVVGAIVMIYMFYGTAFSNSVDRIQYRTLVAPKAYSQLITVLVFLSFFLGLVRRARGERGARVYPIDALFFVALVLLALGGEKFSMLFTSISLYVAPHFFAARVNFRFGKLIKFGLIGIVALSAVILLTVNQYIGIAGEGVWDVIGSLMVDRVSQQGQLNFYFDKAAFVDHITHGDFLTFVEVELLGMDASGSYSGIQLLMNAASPSDLFGIYADAGVTFGDGFPGILFYYFGWSSVLFMAFFGYLYGVLTSFCVRVALQGRVFAGLILFYVLYNISLSAFLNGELRLLLDVTVSKVIAVALFLLISIVHWTGFMRARTH